MLGVVVVYLGLIVASLGGLSVLRPLSFLAIRTRRQAALAGDPDGRNAPGPFVGPFCAGVRQNISAGACQGGAVEGVGIRD